MTHEVEQGRAGNRWRWIVMVLVVVLVAAGCAMPLIQAPAPGTEDSAATVPASPTATAGATATTAATEPATAAAAPSSAPVVASETYKDLPVGFTAEGYPFRGSPDAPIVVYEYSDYGCPFCARYFVQTEPALDEAFVRDDQVRFVFRDFPLAELHPNAPAAHTAALCVAEQGSAAQFWKMHDQLFSTQTVWTNMTDPQTQLGKLAEEVGVDMPRFNDCIASGAMKAKIEQSLGEGRELGITGTPTFNFVRSATNDHFLLVGAQPYDQFAGMITSLVAGETPPQAQQPAQESNQGSAQIPFWATAEGLAPDPDHPGLNMAGDFYRGNPDAKVVVIEFSDFQCPYCRRHVEETQPILDEDFVNTDKVLWVFKHYPLDFHPQAKAAAVAAECAADQQKFWEMHDLLFKNVEQWSVSDPAPVFAEYATELALDMEKFNSCLTAGDAQARVESDMSDGAPFVQGTPTFIVLFNGEGRIIPGALPADSFKSALQQILDQTAQ